MTTFAPEQDSDNKIRAIDENTRAAWQRYTRALDGLSGRKYERAETGAWKDLQATLSNLEAERAELLAEATSNA